MKSAWAPVVFLVCGVVVLAAALYLALPLAVTLFDLGLAGAAFIAAVVTRHRRPNPSGRTAVAVAAVGGIVLVLLGFSAIYFAYWFRSVGG